MCPVQSVNNEAGLYRGKAHRRPSSPRPRRKSASGMDAVGRDAALQAAWGTAREPGPEGATGVAHLRNEFPSLR